ncbi:hypothetical protein [Trichlorobacter lovleyi]|uniref:hypothetical protein n=1 Tax=Trichlorobacter lovleyi TaxID=313985 RepID=UPI002FDDC565
MKNTGAGGAIILLIIIAIVVYVLINNGGLKQRATNHVESVKNQISTSVAETREKAGAAVAGRPAPARSKSAPALYLASSNTSRDVQMQHYSSTQSDDAFYTQYPDQQGGI